ncbi:MAG: hypothetical protein U9Q21_02560 [Candidatus Auribacterota bacterium]|nr:hypothetical protein [Candidatus Auribacterota bacterium]
MGKIYKIKFSSEKIDPFGRDLEEGRNIAVNEFKAKFPKAQTEIIEKFKASVVNKRQAEKDLLKSLLEFCCNTVKSFSEINEISKTIRDIEKPGDYALITEADIVMINRGIGLEFPEKYRFLVLKELSWQLQKPYEFNKEEK